MTIEISTPHNSARLQGTLNFLDTGPANARIQIFGGTRPASVNDAPAAAPLVEIELTKPAGTVTSGILTLTAAEDGLILTTGVAVWARVINGADATAFDCDAGEGVGPWEVQLAQVTLLAGGEAKLVSALLG